MFNAKKAGVLAAIFLFITVLFILVKAQEDMSTKAFACLEKNVKGKCASVSLPTAELKSLSLLALSYNYEVLEDCKKGLYSTRDSRNCWPAGNCNLKDTALAAIALKSIGENTTHIENWLISRQTLASELEWYLEFDADSAMNCWVYYDDAEYPFTMNADKTLSAAAGPCLKFGYGKYWYRIEPSCLTKKFTSRCDVENSRMTVLYKKPGPGPEIWYVSSNVKITAKDLYSEPINISFYCFSNSGTACDYEGSLWAAYALKRAGYNSQPFIPYLKAFSDESANLKYFPKAFLNLLGVNFVAYLNTNAGGYYPTGHWRVAGDGMKYYDTALASLSLGSVSQTTKDWLSATKNTAGAYAGCWNGEGTASIRDTAFLLWAGWSKEAAASCTKAGGYCMNQSACTKSKGTPLTAGCLGTSICCSEPPLALKNCTPTWTACGINEKCTGQFATANDTARCCTNGTCELKNCSNIPGTELCDSIFGSCTGTELSSLDLNGKCCLGTCKYNNCTGTGGIGKQCQTNEKCTGKFVKTPDMATASCCISGDCTLKKCLDIGGKVCSQEKKCSTLPIASEEGSTACCTGTCVYKNCSEIGTNCSTISSIAVCSNNTVSTPDNPKCCLTSLDAKCIDKNCSVLQGAVCNESINTCNISTINTPDQNKCCLGKCLEYCEPASFCLNSKLECGIAAGSVLDKFCSSGKSCCNKAYTPQKTCAQITDAGKTGKFCAESELCNGSLAMASDGLCCVGECYQQTCEAINGTVCATNEKCSGELTNTTNTQNCCKGTCVIKTIVEDCQQADYFCMSPEECDNTGGNLMNNFVCSGRGSKVCCDKEELPPEKSCKDLGGRQCSNGQECSGSTESSVDTPYCCLNKYECATITPPANACEDAGNVCRNQCLSDEEAATESCSTGKLCCKSKESPKSYLWIIILVGAIILIALGILFRNQLRTFFFNLKNKFSKGSPAVIRRGPPFMPPALGRPGSMLIRRPMPSSPIGRQTSAPRPSSKTDRELEDTLKKLREMSK